MERHSRLVNETIGVYKVELSILSSFYGLK